MFSPGGAARLTASRFPGFWVVVKLSCLRAEWFFARNCRRRLCSSTPRLCVSRCGSAPAWRGMDDGSIVRPTTFPRTEVCDAAEGGPGARRAGAHEGVLEMTALKVQHARSSRTRPRLRQLSAPARAPIAQAMPPIARVPSPARIPAGRIWESRFSWLRFPARLD